ncbi:hypothetical protein [Mangrovibacterium marinum]|uniref:Uncharacterized protein n=1 Tax=Mangrovibacterium marinum TaxID=1639118 RepID=A0A2T5BPD1_9BACT|nr:hypothetical protein [Mangrovibacterium marinum]PTN00882.1 hypothetical protein C8N47_1531 [Mangrovibacterium marinum]
MTGTFKIQKDKVKSIVYQDLKRVSLIAFFSMIFPLIMIAIMIPKEDLEIYLLVIPLIFSLLILTAIVAYMYNFKIVYYEAFELTILENGLHKKIDIENNKKVTGLRAWAWHRQKLLSKQHDTLVDWDKIKSVKRLKHGLLIKARYSDFYGYGLIAIPDVLEDFEQIVIYIENKIKAN